MFFFENSSQLQWNLYENILKTLPEYMNPANRFLPWIATQTDSPLLSYPFPYSKNTLSYWETWQNQHKKENINTLFLGDSSSEFLINLFCSSAGILLGSSKSLKDKKINFDIYISEQSICDIARDIFFILFAIKSFPDNEIDSTNHWCRLLFDGQITDLKTIEMAKIILKNLLEYSNSFTIFKEEFPFFILTNQLEEKQILNEDILLLNLRQFWLAWFRDLLNENLIENPFYYNPLTNEEKYKPHDIKLNESMILDIIYPAFITCSRSVQSKNIPGDIFWKNPEDFNTSTLFYFNIPLLFEPQPNLNQSISFDLIFIGNIQRSILSLFSFLCAFKHNSNDQLIISNFPSSNFNILNFKKYFEEKFLFSLSLFNDLFNIEFDIDEGNKFIIWNSKNDVHLLSNSDINDLWEIISWDSRHPIIFEGRDLDSDGSMISTSFWYYLSYLCKYQENNLSNDFLFEFFEELGVNDDVYCLSACCIYTYIQQKYEDLFFSSISDKVNDIYLLKLFGHSKVLSAFVDWIPGFDNPCKGQNPVELIVVGCIVNKQQMINMQGEELFDYLSEAAGRDLQIIDTINYQKHLNLISFYYPKTFLGQVIEDEEADNVLFTLLNQVTFERVAKPLQIIHEKNK